MSEYSTQVPAWPPLPDVALQALFGVQRAGLQPWQPLADVLEDTARARLLRRMTPPGGLEKLTDRDARLLGLLLDGRHWTKEAIEDAIDMPDRHARRAVEALRHAGFPVMSRSSADAPGYWLTSDADEIEDYIVHEVTPRAMRQHEIAAKMRAAALRCRATELEGAVQPAQLPIPDFNPSGGCEQ